MIPTFRTFLQAGFECATHRRSDGRRLDLLHATRHDRFADADYAALLARGIGTVRDGLRWHRIERADGTYDWSCDRPMLRAARDHGVQVIWDLCHYGWPDHLDVWSAAFVERFARFAGHAAQVVREQTGAAGWFSPVNEISYWAWAGGTRALFNPGVRGRGDDLKRQLVRAAIAAIEAVRAVDPEARFVQCDPLIRVVAAPGAAPASVRRARIAHEAQFEAWELLTGRREPELGGRPEHLDVVGANYFSRNQWFLGGRTIPRHDASHQPLRHLLADLHRRLGRPILLSETSAEGAARAPWLREVADEVAAARAMGVPVVGICLYPITDYPGWSNGRWCTPGLFGRADDAGGRVVDAALAAELARQQARFREPLPL